MASPDFDPDGLVQAKRLIDELERDGEVDGRVIRVLRILTDQVEMLRDSD